MNIAIYGKSGSGKSATAQALACKLKIEVRGCGDEVKKLAKSKGVALSELSDADHVAVDSETLDFANQRDEWIIEGRFLDQVLKEFQKPFFLILLEASAEVRAGRLENRDSRITHIDDIKRYDEDDSLFCTKVYSESKCRQPNFVIDCAKLDVYEVVDEIIKFCSKLRKFSNACDF